MQSSQGQKYIPSLFFSGYSADVDPELLEAKNSSYLESHAMTISRTLRNVLQVIRGDKSFGPILPGFPSIGSTITINGETLVTDTGVVVALDSSVAYIDFIGGVWLNGYVVTFYRDSLADLTYIYANGVLIGQNANYPKAMFDCDTNSETWEIVITDNVTVPIVLNLQDMLAHVNEEIYFADYDFKLYSVNKPLQLNQPVFVRLEDLGAGSGLKVGSYAYAMCYASKSGESTPWGPLTPYIPVPESAVSLLSNGVDSYAPGLKTWGGETSLTPGRYGIRLQVRIANLSGFDYIKIKRYANNTGQPVSYTPVSEFIILTTDSDGGVIDIKANPYSIIEFTDSDSKDWAILDDSVSQAYSTIKTSRTARFYDRRIILGGVEYESKLLEDKDIFITEVNTNRIAFPIVKALESGKVAGGFSNIYNQVYNKSVRLGERYGYAAELRDEQGNKLFAVPLKMHEDKDDFTNFQFPNRRDKIPAGVKRVDTIVLSGDVGSADIVCDGVTATATFHKTLTQTAADFVTNHAADYIGGGVLVTSYQQNIIFTSTVAGVDFTGLTTIITQATSNLTGTVITTQSNVPPVVQVDVVLFQAYAGTGLATIGCSTTTGYMQRTLTYSGNDARLGAVAFVTAYAADFLTAGVTLSVHIEGGVTLTGLSDGSPMTTTAVGTLIKTTAAVYTSVAGAVGACRVDTITFSSFAVSPHGPIGSADILCNGVSKPITFDMGWTLSAQNFVTNYAADYLPVVVTSSANTLIFTGATIGLDFVGETLVTLNTGGDLAGEVTSQAMISNTPQRDEVVIEGTSGEVAITCEGLTHYVIFDTDIPTSLENFYNANHTYYEALGVTVEFDTTSLYFIGPADGVTTITTTAVNDSGDLTPTVHTVDYPALGVPQMDTVTLTGYSGNARITCNAMTKGITFTSSLADTAIKFCTNYQALYAAIGIDVAYSGNDIIFTALDENTPFYGTTVIVNAADDIISSVGISPAVSPVAQVDIVTLLGSSGTATITCQGVTKSVTFNTDLEITAHNFYDNFHTFYTAVGVTVGFTSSGTITFTGPASGSAIVTTAAGTLVDSIYTISPNAYGVAQIDKVTITTGTGNVNITCNGITRGVSYITSPTATASRFVSDWASAYLAEIQVTSVGPDIFFTKILELGVAFTGATSITTVPNNLIGVVVNTRANASGGGEETASPAALEDSTVDSINSGDVAKVYDPVIARRLSKQDNDKELNIISAGDPDNSDTPIPYNPVTPTGRGSLPNNNNYDDILQMNIMDTVEGHSYNVGQYGSYISTVGLRIGGIDVNKLPSTVKSFSIVRTPAAGRVVCQGIGMYALTEQVPGSTNPSLVKALNKLWFYSPEIDSVIGTKGGIYEDIKANPSNYQIQLVAPCGFFSDFYSSYFNNVAGTDGFPICLYQDVVSMPICGAGDDAKTMFPPDHDQSIGRSDYISFGKWRNTANQGAGLALNTDLIFNISAAQDVPHAKIRASYLEITLGLNDNSVADSDKIYYSTDVKNEACTTAQSIAFHEPWYIINIIQNKEIPNNNVNSYNDIGHSIRLESIIGLSSGETKQVLPLVEERREDVYGLGETASTYRYIWVDGKPWLDSNNIASVAAYLVTLESTGKFTPTGGLECYGIYTLNSDNAITFAHVLPASLVPVVPVAGAQIVVKYNNNSPIEVFLGDTYVANASFLAVDVHVPADNFRLEAPMPNYDFTLKTTYHQADNGLGASHTDIWDDLGTYHTSYLRQWLIHFTCESTVNLPLAYKNFFPNRLYAMRPFGGYDVKLDTETVNAFFTRLKIYPQYNDDYPNEYLNWLYGGLSTPASVNYDYEKTLSLKSYAEPQSGANEFLSLMKRLHWSTQRIPGFESNKVFVPTNIYDLKNDKASQISILYDQFSERGSNLYVITDRGAGMLLFDKQMITTSEGNNLTIMANNASLIKGEVWLSGSIGCPGEFWRGKSEGVIKLPNNIVAPILVFPSQDDIVMLTNNTFVQIADNIRQSMLASLESITDDTKLYSVIDRGENRLWITIGTNTYTFNFNQNNWDGSVKSLVYDKSFNADYLEGSTEKNVLVHTINTATQFGLSMSYKGSNRFTTIGDVPYVVFSVTPELGRAMEFVDMYISASAKPYSIQFATDILFTDPVTVLGTTLKEYEPGLYYLQGIPRTTIGSKRMIGKTLFVKLSFPGTAQMYNLKLTNVGYKNIEGN